MLAVNDKGLLARGSVKISSLTCRVGQLKTPYENLTVPSFPSHPPLSLSPLIAVKHTEVSFRQQTRLTWKYLRRPLNCAQAGHRDAFRGSPALCILCETLEECLALVL